MEPFSVAAAAITLCPVIIQTARQLRNAAKSIKYARRELEDLTDEMNIFSTFYDQFIQATKTRMKRTESASSARKRLISWAENAKSDFEKLSHRVDALSRDPQHDHSATEIISAHCKWYLKKSHLSYLRYTLVVARQSMVGFTNMCHIEKLDELLAELRFSTPAQRTKIEREEGMDLEQIVIRLEAKKKQLREQASFTDEIAKEAVDKISSKQSRNQNEDYSTHTEQLLSFSRTVDRYTKRTLYLSSRSSQKSSHSSSSAPSSSSSPSSVSSRSTTGSRRVGSPGFFERHVRIQVSKPAVDESHQDLYLYTGPDPAYQEAVRLRHEARLREAKRIRQENEARIRIEAERLEAERLEAERLEAERLEAERLEAERLEAERLEAERIRQDIARQREETRTTKIDPNYIPPLSVPNRSNDTHHSKPRTDTKIPTSTEPTEAPPISHSESTNGVVGDSNGESSESEMEEIASNQATYTGNSKWRATGAFQGTEPRNLRERRRRGS